MPSLFRRSLAEALGTFALVFIGTGAVITKYYPDANYGVLGVAVAHALVLSVMVTATMSISGGHLNPAVTLGLLSARRTTVQTAGAYILAQLVGAVLASLVIRVIYPVAVWRAASLGTPTIAGSITLPQALIVEAVLTFFLVSAVFGTCVNPEAPKVGGFGVGLVLLFDIIMGGPLTGAAMNPARAFGPALVSGQWVGHLIYWVGPIAGGVLAALFWEHLLLPKRTA
jgi:MIP family channel proteins